MPARRRRPPGAPRPPLNPQDIARAATLKRYRETRDFSQSELGSMLGVSQSTIVAYEQAKTRIPDDVFGHLSDLAAEDLQAAENAEGIEQAMGAGGGSFADVVAGMGMPPMPDGEMPPEVAEALRNAGEAMRDAKTPDEAASRIGKIAADVGAKAKAAMPREQQAAARDVQLAYGLLARVFSRFDPILAELVDQQSGELAMSVVQAAEVSPFFERIVKMMKIGPVSTCIALHVMLVMQYDERRRAFLEEQRRQRAALAGPRQEPQPAQAVERIDASMTTPFEAAAATAA
jgi:hypothetical protein